MIAVELDDGTVWAFREILVNSRRASYDRVTYYVAECVWHPAWAN